MLFDPPKTALEVTDIREFVRLSWSEKLVRLESDSTTVEAEFLIRLARYHELTKVLLAVQKHLRLVAIVYTPKVKYLCDNFNLHTQSVHRAFEVEKVMKHILALENVDRRFVTQQLLHPLSEMSLADSQKILESASSLPLNKGTLHTFMSLLDGQNRANQFPQAEESGSEVTVE